MNEPRFARGANLQSMVVTSLPLGAAGTPVVKDLQAELAVLPAAT